MAKLRIEYADCDGSDGCVPWAEDVLSNETVAREVHHHLLEALSGLEVPVKVLWDDSWAVAVRQVPDNRAVFEWDAEMDGVGSITIYVYLERDEDGGTIPRVQHVILWWDGAEQQRFQLSALASVKIEQSIARHIITTGGGL